MSVVFKRDLFVVVDKEILKTTEFILPDNPKLFFWALFSILLYGFCSHNRALPSKNIDLMDRDSA